MIKLNAFLWLTFVSVNVLASEVKIIDAQVNCNKSHRCSFDVTLKHADTGWQHYANYWQVVDEKSKILVERTLYHPHVNEQPFTRSSTAVLLNRDLKKVWIKAGDNVEGLNSKPYVVKLP